MMDLIKREEQIDLFDVYQSLLTKKQRDYFLAYYFDDLSLSEIADNFNVSRNAVFDQIKKTLAILEEYEEKLHLVKRNKMLSALKETLPQPYKEELETILEED